MSVFEQMKDAMAAKDAGAMIGLLHDDFVFVRHQSGGQMNKSEMSEMLQQMSAEGGWSVSDHRCLYENDDIMVEHSVMSFADGSREAVLVAHMLKDGKVVRMETGATKLD